MSRFTSSNGNVIFNVDKMVGCCGVAIVYSVRFHEVYNKAAFYEEFHTFLSTQTGIYDLDRCKVLMSDSVRTGNGPSIYDFCTTKEWMVGEPTFNRKSGNQVVVFELSRQTSRTN